MKDWLDTDIAEAAAGLGDVAEAFAGKTIMMTGARGFLGRHFAGVFAYLNEKVLSKPCQFIGFDNMVTAGAAGSRVEAFPNLRFIKQDIIKPFSWDDPVDYIIHAAGIASPFYYRAFPLETLEVAISGTRNMLDIATKHRARLAFFSSSEI